MCAVGNVTWDDYLKRNNFDEDKDFQLIK